MRHAAADWGVAVVILIPAKDAAATLERAIASVAAQESKRWTMMVLVDRSSSDDTYRAAMRLREQIPGNKLHVDVSAAPGLSNVYVELIETARPDDDILGFLDADDVLFPGAVEKMRAVYERRPELGHVWSQHTRHPSGRSGSSGPLPAGKGLKEALLGGWWGAHHFRTFRKSVYECSEFPLPVDLTLAADYSLALVLAAADCLGCFHDEVLYAYHQLPTGIMRSRPSELLTSCKEAFRRFVMFCGAEEAGSS